MELVANKLNNVWLDSILIQAKYNCDYVKAAVAYSDGTPKLMEFCFSNNIPLSFWGRYDASVPISINILERFISRNSLNYVCKLVPEIFHPKVIWWGGLGAYIGSANLTENGWFRNIECGLFISQSELVGEGLDIELERFFAELDNYAYPLSQEILDEQKSLEEKNKDLRRELARLRSEFERQRIIPKADLLLPKLAKPTDDRLREDFLADWYSTLNLLRTIGHRVSEDNNRPRWINNDVPGGIQADQFLHAYYYNRVADGKRYPYRLAFEQNKSNPDRALLNGISWWKSLEAPPSNEDVTIYQWAPYLLEMLSKDKLLTLNFDDFRGICSRIHSVRDHSLRVRNETYGLPKNTSEKDRDTCIQLLAKYLWARRSESGKSILEVIYFVLYGGLAADVANRLWEATRSNKWRIPHLGISSLSEMVGWAMPGTFPPRNDRTNKALVALGNNVVGSE